MTNTGGTDVCVEKHDHFLPCNATALFPKEANLVTLWHEESKSYFSFQILHFSDTNANTGPTSFRNRTLMGGLSETLGVHDLQQKSVISL